MRLIPPQRAQSTQLGRALWAALTLLYLSLLPIPGAQAQAVPGTNSPKSEEVPDNDKQPAAKAPTEAAPPDRETDAAAPEPTESAAESADAAGQASPESGNEVPQAQAQAQAPSGLQPPRLQEFAPAEYPPSAVEAGIAGRVELELLIDATGTVTESTVVGGVHPELDAAARQASFQLRFAPATNDGVGIPARIRFPYVFELQTTEEPEAPAEAELVGRVEHLDGDPVEGATVIALPEDGSSRSYEVRSDATGRFAFEPLPPGTYLVRVVADDLQERVEQENLIAGDRTTVTYQLNEAPDPSAYGAVARIPPPPREVTRRTINRTQLTRIPGTRGDALRAVELLPGVARPPFTSGLLIIRGSSPGDSEVQLEGAPLALLYHFGALTSVFSSQLIESIDFFPGNFSTRYGRRRGGIVEVNVRDPNSEKFAGVADINLLDSSLTVEGPITDNWEFAVAARRSYIDLVFEQVVPEDEVGVIAAPVYLDYQLITTYRPTDRDKLRLMAYGSSDKLELLFQEPSDETTAGADQFGFGTEFQRVQLSWYRKVTESVDHDLELSAEHRAFDVALGTDISLNLETINFVGRSEWRSRLNDSLQLIGGLDIFAAPGSVRYKGPVVDQGEGSPDQPIQGSDRTERDRDFVAFRPAAYLELAWDLAPVRLVAGLRLDYFNIVKSLSLDPRITGFYALTPATRLKLGVGMFTQPPEYQESDAVLGNPDVKPTKTLHLTAGVEHTVDEDISLGVESFYKHLYDLIVGTPNGEAPGIVNGGKGRIYGLEVSAKVEPRGRFFGYLSYTLSRSERKDIVGDYRLFDFDQTHILTAASVYRLGAGWELGATFRLVSGNPDTPVLSGTTDTTNDVVYPVYGATNSVRSPMFHRLDVLVRKTWDFDSWRFITYLDVQNIYNRQNPEGLLYGPRYKTQTEVSGLPILPNLGVRGEF